MDISPGANDGEEFWFPGRADEHPDRETGDMIVILRSQEHPQYQRDGVNLYTTMHLTIREALRVHQIATTTGWINAGGESE